MIETTPSLFDPRPVVRDLDVRELEALLASAGGWLYAREVLARLGRPVTEDGKREIRAIAAECPRILSGQRGYCHLRHATPEEIHHAKQWLISQGKQMISRGIAIARAAHAAVR